MTQLTMIAHVVYGCAVPFATAVRKSCEAISAAEPPPMPLKSATIWGIAVMRTKRAETAPMTVPTTIGGMIKGQLPVLWMSTAVMPSTSSMPTAAMRFPCRAVAGERSS